MSSIAIWSLTLIILILSCIVNDIIVWIMFGFSLGISIMVLLMDIDVKKIL